MFWISGFIRVAS